MSFLDLIPWQQRIATLANRILSPDQIERRMPFWRSDDIGLSNDDQNTALRLHSYASDGHDARQEVTLAAGTGAGQIISGNDNATERSSHITYADAISHIADSIHFQVPQDGLGWNYTTFNARLNPTFTMPTGLSGLQDAFDFAKASVGLEGTSLDELKGEISDIQGLVGDVSITGDADFTSPFSTYCTLTPQKLPLWNYGMIMFMQMLVKGMPLFMAGPVPVTLSPLGIKVAATVRASTTTAYGPSTRGKVLGREVRDLLISSVPGLNLIMQ